MPAGSSPGSPSGTPEETSTAPRSKPQRWACGTTSRRCAAGADIRRIVAVGGGTQGRLWLQIVSDITGLVQEVPQTTIGASYGAAFLAATATAAEDAAPAIADWNPIADTVRPDEALRPFADALFDRYVRLYDGSKDVVHELAAAQRDGSPTTSTPENS